jgi:hypothetical protein
MNHQMAWEKRGILLQRRNCTFHLIFRQLVILDQEISVQLFNFVDLFHLKVLKCQANDLNLFWVATYVDQGQLQARLLGKTQLKVI